MLALPIISIICCIAYIFYVVIKFGIPVSLSETYYLLPNKQDFLFSVWTVMTGIPFGIYWFTISPSELVWIPITISILLPLIGCACRYKSIDKPVEIIQYTKRKSLSQSNSIGNKITDFVKETLAKFKPSVFLQYGWARPLHYIASILAIILSTVYICILNKNAIISTCILYPVFIFLGMFIEGSYNKHYSVDVNNKAWIFLMEIICFTQIFIYTWKF